MGWSARIEKRPKHIDPLSRQGDMVTPGDEVVLEVQTAVVDVGEASSNSATVMPVRRQVIHRCRAALPMRNRR